MPVSDPREIEVSVVMPCLNEAESVGVCVEKAWKALNEMGISGEPSVEPLSTTTTSPEIPMARRARQAFSTHTPTDSASFRQGITTETSISSGVDAGKGAAFGFTEKCPFVAD